MNVWEECNLLRGLDDSFLVPPGWLWYCADKENMQLADSYTEGLRDWGYVFWDQSRLERLGILKQE